MLTKQSILESIEAFLISRYKSYHANARSDWYKELELNNFRNVSTSDFKAFIIIFKNNFFKMLKKITFLIE